eukprot:321481-Pleurochrysis_carterae.AAC.1
MESSWLSAGELRISKKRVERATKWPRLSHLDRPRAMPRRTAASAFETLLSFVHRQRSGSDLAPPTSRSRRPAGCEHLCKGKRRCWCM